MSSLNRYPILITEKLTHGISEVPVHELVLFPVVVVQVDQSFLHPQHWRNSSQQLLQHLVVAILHLLRIQRVLSRSQVLEQDLQGLVGEEDGLGEEGVRQDKQVLQHPLLLLPLTRDESLVDGVDIGVVKLA